MKEEIIKRLEDEYKSIWEEISEINKELLAIERSKKSSRLGNALLFGVLPSLLVAFFVSRIYAAGFIELSTLTVTSVLSTLGISGTALALFEKKFDFKGERKQYNIPNNEEGKLERIVELEEKKYNLEVQQEIVKKYYKKVTNEDYQFVNNGEDKETVLADEKYFKENVERHAKMRYLNDKFEDYRTGNKNPFKSGAAGLLLGMLLAGSIIYVPQIMGGVALTSLAATPFTLLTTFLTGAVFGTHAAIDSNNKKKIFERKNKELGSLELPRGLEPIYLTTRSMLSSAVKEYETTLEKKDSLSAPVVDVCEDIEYDFETKIITAPVKDEIKKLSKKC